MLTANSATAADKVNNTSKKEIQKTLQTVSKGDTTKQSTKPHEDVEEVGEGIVPIEEMEDDDGITK